VKHERQQAVLRGERGEVIGWVETRLSEEEEAAIRERLIRWRFEHVDEYLVRIDELLRELAELGAVDTGTADTIREVRETVMRPRPSVTPSE
jgi:hypothetical protein